MHTEGKKREKQNKTNRGTYFGRIKGYTRKKTKVGKREKKNGQRRCPSVPIASVHGTNNYEKTTAKKLQNEHTIYTITNKQLSTTARKWRENEQKKKTNTVAPIFPSCRPNRRPPHKKTRNNKISDNETTRVNKKPNEKNRIQI